MYVISALQFYFYFHKMAAGNIDRLQLTWNKKLTFNTPIAVYKERGLQTRATRREGRSPEADAGVATRRG